MGSVVPFNVHSIDDVYDELPPGVRPTKPKFKELVELHGLYRDLGGKHFMLDADIAQLFEIIRARPKEADMRGGPARLIAGDTPPSPNQMGYLVVLGDKLDTEAAVFVGWAPRDGEGVGDLRKLVQYGYPGKLSTLDTCAATPLEVEEVRTKFKRASVGGVGWYARTWSAPLNRSQAD